MLSPKYVLKRLGLQTAALSAALRYTELLISQAYIPRYSTVTSAKLELVSKELNHFGVIAGLFRQIEGHSSRFVL